MFQRYVVRANVDLWTLCNVSLFKSNLLVASLLVHHYHVPVHVRLLENLELVLLKQLLLLLTQVLLQSTGHRWSLVERERDSVGSEYLT